MSSSVTDAADKLLTSSQNAAEPVDTQAPLYLTDGIDSTTEIVMNADVDTCQTSCDHVTSQPVMKCEAATIETDDLLPSSSIVPTQLFKRRWLIIFLFASYSMSNAYQWIHLNIIFDKVCPSAILSLSEKYQPVVLCLFDLCQTSPRVQFSHSHTYRLSSPSSCSCLSPVYWMNAVCMWKLNVQRSF